MATYFVRIKGTVHGPVTEKHLERMARRGIVTPNTQVSTDGTTWRRASEVLPFFAEPTTSEEATPSASETTEADGSRWYYQSADGQAAGPVSEEALVELIRLGRVRPDTLVWCQGMEDWKPASQTSLAQHFVQAAAAPGGLKATVAYPSYRPSRGYVVGLPLVVLSEFLAAAASIGLLVMLAGMMPEARRGWNNGPGELSDAEAVLVLSMCCGIPLMGFLPALFTAYTVYAWWSALPEGWRRTSPAMAGIGLLIPIFNLFWVFVALGGLGDDVQEYIRRNGLPITAPGSVLGYTVAGVWAARALVCWMPGVVALLAVIELLLFLAFGVKISRACDGIIEHATRAYGTP